MPFAQHFFGAIAILLSALNALAVRMSPFPGAPRDLDKAPSLASEPWRRASTEPPRDGQCFMR
jgi:hypothetical protein